MSSSKKTTYREFLGRQSKTSVWDYFTAADDRKTAKCKECDKVLKTGGGSTSGLHTHLLRVHKVDISTKDNAASTSTAVRSSGTRGPRSTATPSTSSSRTSKEEPASKKTKMTDYFKSQSQDSMESVVARMSALDGFPLSKFCTSKDLRRLFLKSGYENLPRSPTSITKIVLSQSECVKNEMKKMISDLKDKEHRFTSTFDEYTNGTVRYMNINIHNKDMGKDKFKNLGLVRIEGSLNAAAATQYFLVRLQDFGLTSDDIIGITTDGASVMTKLGRNFEGHHQLCMAHGIQLAVIDVLYKFQFHETASPIIAAPDTYDSDSDSDEEDHVIEEDSLIVLPPARLQGRKPEFVYKELIDKVRKIVRLFRKSPTKNDLLQKHIIAENAEGKKKPLQLILDCKTRWSSMSDMIGRFLELKGAVSKTLIDLKINLPLDESDIASLENIHAALAVVKVTVLALCKRDANLITADAALKFMLRKLDERPNDLSRNLAGGLRKRIKERRTVISGVLQYLHDNETFYNDHHDVDTFRQPSSDEIHGVIVALLQRMKFKNIVGGTVAQEETQSPMSPSPSTSTNVVIEHGNTSKDNEEVESIEVELAKEINKSRVQKKLGTAENAEERDLDSIIRVEMCVYDSSGGGREVFLTAAYEYLLSVVPTSVESERAFSSVGYLCNRLRSSLSDNTLNALSFLRSHYQNQENSDKED